MSKQKYDYGHEEKDHPTPEMKTSPENVPEGNDDVA
jgi:hypothetical protein